MRPSDAKGTRVLVSAGSKHGATVEIAQRIAEVLREWGHDVDVACPDQVASLDRYEVVVLGSAVYAGHWVESAQQLADRVAESNPRPETWLFSSGSLGVAPNPDVPPIDVSDILGATGAREHRLFGGKIDKSKLSVSEKAILVAVRASDGDHRNWDEVASWSREIAERLAFAVNLPSTLAS